MNEWISVKDSLPEFDEKVLCYDTQKIYIAFRKKENSFDEYNEHWVICEENCSCPGITGPVTHWMPLPEVPNE